MSEKIALADVVRRFLPSFREKHSLLPSQERALHDIMHCMTGDMGGGRYHCDDCDESFWSYHGCRNRSCPQCHGRQTAQWLQKRQAELLPVPYFHVVATVPSELRDLFRRHQKILYGLLMQSAAGALCGLLAERHYLGAEPGILSVLHTWDTQLLLHPHVHMLVTGGGVCDGGWCGVPSAGYLVPVEKLSSRIASRFCATLHKEHPEIHAEIPAAVWKRQWCTFCKPFGTGRDAVLNYLARYVFRIAITNARIIRMDESHLTLRRKINRTGKWKTLSLSGVEFLRRFLMHVLPRGFHKVRYYGHWSPAKREQQLRARLLFLLKKESAGPERIGELAEEALERSGEEDHGYQVRCPKCRSVRVTLLQQLRRGGHLMPT